MWVAGTEVLELPAAASQDSHQVEVNCKVEWGLKSRHRGPRRSERSLNGCTYTTWVLKTPTASSVLLKTNIGSMMQEGFFFFK